MTASRCLLGKEVRETMFERVSSLFYDLDMTGGERNLRRIRSRGPDGSRGRFPVAQSEFPPPALNEAGNGTAFRPRH